MMRATKPARARELLHGATAALLLSLITLAVPAILIALAQRLPLNASNLPDRLTRTDDGSLFLLALFAVAWISWLAFTASLGLEIVALLRGIPTPSLPGISALQRGAASLVAGATLLFGPAGATGPTARPVAAVQLIEPDRIPTAVPVTGHPHAQPTRPSGPVITVQRHDTLWSLAEAHLGSGERYRDILRLNLGVVQADGRKLSESRWIYPGWQLALPADGSHTAPRTEYVVESGDSLSEIASHELGSASAVDELFRMNRGKPQLDRQTLTDPDLILPGWHLQLGADPPAATPVEPVHPEPGVPLTPLVTASPAAPESRQMAPAEEDSSSALTEVGLGLGLITATGLTLELRRRRRAQQRVRRPGSRIPMPGPEGAALERVAATAASPVTLSLAADALGALARSCHTSGRDLPNVLLARISETALRLQMTSYDDAVVGPFVLDDEGMWLLKGATSELAGEDPYPALVTLGSTGKEMLLLNLEAVGTLDVHDEIGDAWRALVSDVCVGAMSSSAAVAVTGYEALVSACDDVRCRNLNDNEQLRRDLMVRLDSVRRLVLGLQDVRQARSAPDAPEGLLPEVFMTEDLVDVEVDPWMGACLVRRSKGESASWSVRVNGDAAVLLPIGVSFTPQTLTMDDQGRLVSLLATAQPEIPEPESVETAQRQAVAVALPDVPISMLDLRTDVDAPPRLLVLGRVEVERVHDDAAPHRRRRATELVAYLMLHPGASGREIDEALWPGKRVEKTTRNPFISRARQWLGRDADGQPYLPMVGDGGGYRLSPEVSCDWHDFVRFAQLGLDSGPQGLTALSAALDLVRGRPFLGLDPTTYTWAEADTQNMISAIVDVAHVLAEAKNAAGDYRGARVAATKGLLAEPSSEILFRDALRAALGMGDMDEVERLTARLRHEIALVDPDESLDDETLELLGGRNGRVPAEASP